MCWLRHRRKIEKALFKFCFCAMNERVYCIELLLARRSGYNSIVPSVKNCDLRLANQQHRPHGKCFGKKTMLCVGRIRMELCTMSYWNRTKPSMDIATNNKWLIWTKQCAKKSQNGTRDTNEWYCSTTTQRAIALPSFRIPSKRLNGLCYLTRFIRQTWPRPIIYTYFGRWCMA